MADIPDCVICRRQSCAEPARCRRELLALLERTRRSERTAPDRARRAALAESVLDIDD